MWRIRRFVLRFVAVLAVSIGIVECGSNQGTKPLAPPGANPVSPSPFAAHNFAFWYETWNPQTTPPKLKPSDVIIGLTPGAVPSAHAANKLVLQYQTYYQSTPNTLLLESLSDLLNVGFQINQQFVASIFPAPNNYVLCPNSAALHQRVQDYVLQAINSQYDGIFVDNTFFDPPAHAICDASHQHIAALVEGGIAFLHLLSEVRKTLKTNNPAGILITNPGDPDWADQIATASPSLWDISDVVVWESYGYTSIQGSQHDVWSDTITKSYRYATTAPDKAAKLLVLSYPQNVTEARYAFAVARFFGFNWTANLGQDQQNTTQNGGHFGAFFNDIPYSLGQPVDPLPNATSVLHRTFQNGEIFINTDSTPQSVTLQPGTIYLGAGTASTSSPTTVDLQPRTSAIVIFE